MRKTVIYSFVLAVVCLLAVSSCREKGLQNIRGMVKNVGIHNDTLKSMTLSVNERGDTMVFSLDEARVQRGIMMSGDSVIVDYVYGESSDTLRALVVTLLPAAATRLEEDAIGDTLVTVSINPNATEEPVK